MLSAKVSDLLNIQHRFLRSTHLTRDFKDPSALEHYILTKQTQLTLERIAAGLAPNSGQRAWRITGDYGSGKSSFALVLAHLFSWKRSTLPATLKDAIDFDKIGVQPPQLLPVLVTGTRETLSFSLLQALYSAMKDLFRQEKEPDILVYLQECLANNEVDITDAKILGLLQETAAYLVNAGKATGILITLDELGKFLEFAALHPDRQDIYLLQQLAEVADRSGKHPLFVIGLLHQSFHAYADQLSQSAQKEWEKVSGRFEEILFGQSLDQLVGLTVDALGIREDRLPTDIVQQAIQSINVTHHLGWYGFATSLEYLRDKAARMYPLHPTVLPVLIKIFTRFGQNERSLFSFLLSHEPFGLQDFAERGIVSDQFYRLHHLYDYTRATFGHHIGLQSHHNHWQLIESIISNFHSDDEHSLYILKTIALLNLVDDTRLLASRQAIELAVGSEAVETQRSTEEVLQELHQKKHIIYYRGSAGGYCLWPYTSINLDKAYNDACRAVPPQPKVSLLIQNYLEKRPLVARRHYITTGTLRYFDILYVPVNELSTTIATKVLGAVGRIVIPLYETQEERLNALEFAQSPLLERYPEILIAISQPLGDIAGLLQEVQRWQWISENIPELVNDIYASEEVIRQLTFSKNMLEKRIQSSLGVQQSIGSMENVQWFRQTCAINISDRRSLLAYLSDICDDVYSKAPRLSNELVNRDSLSSAAAAARLRLIELILTSHSKPMLGLDPALKPPEMSIYLSLCKKTGLHQETSKGWAFVEPEQDICNIRPAFQRIWQLLEDQKDHCISIAAIFNELRKPPYGVRDGLVPIFLAVFAVMYEQDVAFYENGSFLQNTSGHDFRRLIKAPDSFEVQFYQVSGPRAELFETLRTMLEIPLPEDRQAKLLDIVRPLFTFAARLPEYTRKTQNVSSNALAIRKVLLTAREPAPFLFRDLPDACGFVPFEMETKEISLVSQFVEVLKHAIEELRSAYSGLLQRIKQKLLNTFDIPNHQFRTILASRSKAIAIKISEPRLKAFCFRLMDTTLPEAEWLEALGSFVCSKIPSSWTDIDEQRLEIELSQLCSWFHRVEATLFNEYQYEYGSAVIHLAVTTSDGREIDQVLYVEPDEVKEAEELQKKISDILDKNGRIGFFAASRVLWQMLSQSKEKED